MNRARGAAAEERLLLPGLSVRPPTEAARYCKERKLHFCVETIAHTTAVVLLFGTAVGWIPKPAMYLVCFWPMGPTRAYSVFCLQL